MNDRLQSWHPGEEERWLEKSIFRRREWLLAAFLVVTVLMGLQTTGLRPDASFEKMIPMQHPYIQAMMRHIAELGATGTTIQVAVENRRGDIFDARYLDVLQKINDEVFYLPGVDRNRMRSLWTPNVRWTEVTELGFEGGTVIDSSYDGSADAMDRLRRNILRSGEIGRLVANDFRSSIVEAPLFDRDPRSGAPLDYLELSRLLENNIRDKYQDDGIRIHIVGFAKIVGDLLEGIVSVLLFGVVALAITALLLFAYSRSLAGTIAPILCSLVAVVWQLGLLTTLGYGLNAYSILVPFLVFAIGVSHGVQVVNGMAEQLAQGHNRLTAAKRCFRNLYSPGMTALVSDAVGFLTMLLIEIQVIKDLGIAASIGVAVIILTNLVLLPVLLSFLGMGPHGVAHARRRREEDGRWWRWLADTTRPGVVRLSLLMALAATAAGLYLRQDLQIGDLDAGAPELHPDSRYNQDNSFITDNYSTSSDVLVVMVETAPNACSRYDNMDLVDRFTWEMENVPGVDSAVALTTVSRLAMAGYNEGNLKWATITRNQTALDTTISLVPESLMNLDCSMAPAALFLDDHKAETLARVTGAVKAFAAQHERDDIRFVLAAGNAGIEAATNEEIRSAQLQMILLVYAVVIALVFVNFGSWRPVVCILVPLGMTSILCEALMAGFGIGVKVATLPVIALGVGVGVDYGIYIYSRLTRFLARGEPLREAYYHTLRSTGSAVFFTGITLALGVATWMFSPIKFQADMGKLLTFMFLWNMVGALWLLPALAYYLVKPAAPVKEVRA